MSAKKLLFKEDEVERLRIKIGQVSQDTNRLYLQLRGQANNWGGIPLGQSQLQAQLLINELTMEAEKLEDLLRNVIKGVQGVQDENKRQASQFGQQLSLFTGMFGSFGTNGTTRRFSIPASAQKAAAHLITSIATVSGRDALSSDSMVKRLRDIIQKSGPGTVNGIAAQSKLKDIYEARDLIARAQTAYKVYQAFGNQAQMNAVHKLAEDARKKLEALGVNAVQYQANKDLSGYFKQPAVKACDYDPSITTSSVPVLQKEPYLLLLQMAVEPGVKGEWAKSQLETLHQGGQSVLLTSTNAEAWREIVNQAMVRDIQNGVQAEEVGAAQGDWQSRPAKKDFIDKYLVDPLIELVTGEKPGIKTQGQQVLEAQFFAMQMEQQSVLSEFANDLQATLRGAASADRLTEVFGAGGVSLKNGSNKNGQVQSPGGVVGNINETQPLSKSNKLEGLQELDDLTPAIKGIAGEVSLYPTRTIDPIKEAQVISRVKELRSLLTSDYKKSGNFALAEVDIVNIKEKEFFAHSSIDELSSSLSERVPNISIQPSQPVFKATDAPNKEGVWYPRDSDTEYKILNQIASELKDNTDAIGTIKLFTELDTCLSCNRVISEFTAKFKNITIEVIHNSGKRIK